MKQGILFLTCCFAGSLLLATPATAQPENMAIAAPARAQSVLPKASTGAEYPAIPPKDPVICMDCEDSSAKLPPLVQFPSHFRALFPAMGGCSYLLFGLLGLVGLGLGLFTLGKLRFREKDN